MIFLLSFLRIHIQSDVQNTPPPYSQWDCRSGKGDSVIHEVRLFDVILDPKGLSEREGRFRGRGMGRFESANGVLGCKPRTSIHHQTNSRLPIRARISYELSQ